jgi:hypothetical protein
VRRAVAVVFVCACGGGGGGGGGGDAPANQVAQQICISETNRYRTTVPSPGTGAPRSPIAESAALDTFATTGAMYDYANGPHAHFAATNGGGIASAENECPQQLGWTLSGTLESQVKACVAAFYNGGPGEAHYENLMNATFAKGGCGTFVGSNNGLTITQDFGN